MSENLVNKLEEELKEERAAHQGTLIFFLLKNFYFKKNYLATKNLIKTLQDSISTHLHKVKTSKKKFWLDC